MRKTFTEIKSTSMANKHFEVFRKNSKKVKPASTLMTVLPLAACGGSSGGGGNPGGNGAPAPSLPAEFIEAPTGVFIARDNRDTTLAQGDATTDLTVTGKLGDDIIFTGSGADTISSSGGDDIIRSGEGADVINAGSGNDAIVLIGTTGANEYTNSDITNAGAGYNLSNVINLANLNGRAVSEVVVGEVINGDSGTNTLFIYGVVDLTGVTLSNVTVLEIHSNVTLSPEQLAMFTTVDGDGNSVINIDVPAGPGTYTLDLNMLDVTQIASININGNITVIIEDNSDLTGIGQISAGVGDTLNVNVGGSGSVNLGTLANTFPEIDVIEVSVTATLDIDDANDISNLGLTEISGNGNIITNGNSDVEDALDDITVDAGINTIPNVVNDTAQTTESSSVSIDVLANDTDSDGDGLTITSVSVAAGNGSVSIVDGEILFDPNGDFNHLNNGQNTTVDVTYTVSDGSATNDGTLTITINGSTDHVVFDDGSSLTNMSLSANSLIRGAEGLGFSFAVSGDPVTITVEVTDILGNDHLYSVSGTNGTMLLPMDGTERQNSASSEININEYTISAVYIEDMDGSITYLNDGNFDAYGFDNNIFVNSGSPGNPDSNPPELSNFDLVSSTITLGHNETPQLLTFTKDNDSSDIAGIMVKFMDEDDILHSTYINGSSGTFSLNFNALTATPGTYTLYSVDVYGTQGNSNSYSASDIESLFGASETTFTLTNPYTIDLGSTAGTPYTYLSSTTHGTSGDQNLDGVLSGSQLTPEFNGDPLIITYSFPDPDNAFFIPGYSNTEFEETQNIRVLSGADQQSVRNVLDDISEDINIIFVEVPDDGMSSAGHMRFAWTNGGTEDVEFTSAWAYYPGGYPQSSDVWFIDGNLDYEQSIDNNDSIFESVILHEIGHALGLKHPFETEGAFGILPDEYDGNEYTVMSYDMLASGNGSYFDYALPTDLMWLDIATLQYLYGANTDRTNGDNTYVILPDEWNYMSVYDSGGTDTFDFSFFETNISIDLTPGAWSDVGITIDINNGNGNIRTETLQIYENTVIENVIGGSGNDTLTGNDENNIIFGGAGADIMAGGSGNDIFEFNSNSNITTDTINGGIGFDTILLNGTLPDINLENINASNVELIQSSSSNPLLLTLDAGDVLDLTDADNELIIAGGIDDAVTSIGQGWAQGADQGIDGETYHTYTSGGATILIDEDITQDIS